MPDAAFCDADPWFRAAEIHEEAGVAAFPDPTFALAAESSTLSWAPELLPVSYLLYIFDKFK